ncbi:Basic-leucine zipper (bZIP) transcription factor family protein [Euphorbia peplus]|nr:Basic-leucine zipper (bZIP) transcription factor family protein [Euphorbia peplus]
MEEVWKDINLASLNGNNHPNLNPPPPHVPNPNFILQDFLTGPLRRDPPSSRICSAVATNRSGVCGSLAPPPPPTVNLSLNSAAPGYDYLDNSEAHFKNHHNNTVICFEGLELDSSSPCNLPSFGNKRRIEDSDNINTSNSCDRRHKRMIKNRESAARSRARKQELNLSSFLSFLAYTQQLQNEVDELHKENARLKNEQKKIYMAAASQLPKKHILHRTSTAPF